MPPPCCCFASPISGMFFSDCDSDRQLRRHPAVASPLPFPACFSQIATVIDNYAATLLRRTDRDCFFVTTQGIVQLVQRYRSGIRGHLKGVIQDLLRQYLQVELHFQQGCLSPHTGRTALPAGLFVSAR